MKRSWVIRTVVAITLSTCLIVALLSMGQPQALVAVFTKVSLIDIGLWLGVYGILVLLRAIRFQQAYPRVGLRTLIRAISVQGGLNRIMPFRLGELSLPYLISQREAQPSGAILFALGWVRLLELFLVCSGMAVGGFLMGMQSNDASVFVGASVAVFATLMFVVVDPTNFAQALSRGMVNAQPGVDRLGVKVGQYWRTAADSLSQLPPIERMARFRLMIWSILVYVTTLGLYFVMLDSVGLSVTISGLLIGVGAAQLSSVLPVLTIGSVGLHEAGWVGGFVLVGMATDAAISSGILTQCATLFLAVFYGGLAYLTIGKGRPTASATSRL